LGLATVPGYPIRLAERRDPGLRLALGKEHDSGAGQSALCRFENNILATGEGLKALEDMLSRSAHTLLRRRNKRRLIIYVDSSEDPVHGKQEGAAFKRREKHPPVG